MGHMNSRYLNGRVIGKPQIWMLRVSSLGIMDMVMRHDIRTVPGAGISLERIAFYALNLSSNTPLPQQGHAHGKATISS